MDSTNFPGKFTVIDYVNEMLESGLWDGQKLDGFGRRVAELYRRQYGRSPERTARFNGERIYSMNLYSERDRPLLDLAFTEQEVRWKEEELEQCRKVVSERMADAGAIGNKWCPGT